MFRIGDRVILKETSRYKQQQKGIGVITSLEKWNEYDCMVKWDGLNSPYFYSFNDLKNEKCWIKITIIKEEINV